MIRAQPRSSQSRGQSATPIDGERGPEERWLRHRQTERRRSARALRARGSGRGIRPLDTAPRATASRDIDDIAVIEDDGTLILRPNAFDLAGVGLRFEPTSAGYDLTPGDASFRPIVGRELALGDDDTAPQTLGFSFPYYGRRFSSLFVNSDGNVTFAEADIASTARGFSRLLDGPPRIAPLFADLDPSSGGHVFVESSADVFAVTWCAVPGFDSPKTITMQVVLTPQGTVDLRYRGGSNDLGEGIAAISPGGSAAFTPADLTAGERQTGGATAIGERFGEDPELDLAQASRRFYQSHPDDFDQLVFWSDTTVVSGAFAFESTVKNAIQGIGVEEFDNAAEFGSQGTLESVLNMDRVAKYGDDPTAKILGENSSLAVLAHESGHRWLAQLLFSDGRGGVSDQLLGRQRSHWSFFMDTDASVMEGNDISARERQLVSDGRRGDALQPRRSVCDGACRRLRGAAVVLRGSAGQRRPVQRSRVGTARRYDVQRHAPQRADPGRHRRARSTRAVDG